MALATLYGILSLEVNMVPKPMGGRDAGVGGGSYRNPLKFISQGLHDFLKISVLIK